MTDDPDDPYVYLRHRLCPGCRNCSRGRFLDCVNDHICGEWKKCRLKHDGKTPELLKTDGAPNPRRSRKTKRKSKTHTPKRKNAQPQSLPKVSENL